MRFPIDILWIRDGRMCISNTVLISRSAEVYRPDQSADRVLSEIAAGSIIQKWGIRVGDPVSF